MQESVRIYKICALEAWRAARRDGVYRGSADDVRDGFLHLSTAEQVPRTLAKHYAGQDDLIAIAFAAHDVPGLRWEPSRGGALFPHVYGTLDPRTAIWEGALDWNGEAHILPAQIV